MKIPGVDDRRYGSVGARSLAWTCGYPRESRVCGAIRAHAVERMSLGVCGGTQQFTSFRAQGEDTLQLRRRKSVYYRDKSSIVRAAKMFPAERSNRESSVPATALSALIVLLRLYKKHAAFPYYLKEPGE